MRLDTVGTATIVTRDGRPVSPVLADNTAAFGWLLRAQPQSVSYALEHGGYAFVEAPGLDARDTDIRDERARILREHEGGPGIGEYVDYPDGVTRRIAYLWWDSTYQPSAGSSTYYLGREGRLNHSGSLEPSRPITELEPAGRVRAGRVWFFSHDLWGAGRGVDTYVDVRVWRAAAPLHAIHPPR